MRIAICSDQYLPLVSGLVDSIDTLARELRARGHSVRIYAPMLPGAERDENAFRFPSWTLPGSGGAMIVAFPLGALRDMRAFKPDVIHTHLAGITGMFAFYATRRLSAPLVGTDHTFPADYLHYAKLDFPPFPYLVRKFSAWYYGRCAFVTTPGSELLKELRDYGMSVPARVVSNPLPTSVFRPLPHKSELKKKFGIGERAILVFGRIAKEKNLDTAVDAFARATGDAELVFIGDGPYRRELEKKLRERGLMSRTRFLGVLRGEPLVEAINACDVCLITSTSETQSLTTVQALACGLPVAAANAGGLKDCVRDGETGYLIDPSDSGMFAERISYLFGDRDALARFGKSARESVLHLSPERIAGEFEAIYDTAVSESKRV